MSNNIQSNSVPPGSNKSFSPNQDFSTFGSFSNSQPITSSFNQNPASFNQQQPYVQTYTPQNTSGSSSYQQSPQMAPSYQMFLQFQQYYEQQQQLAQQQQQQQNRQWNTTQPGTQVSTPLPEIQQRFASNYVPPGTVLINTSTEQLAPAFSPIEQASSSNPLMMQQQPSQSTPQNLPSLQTILEEPPLSIDPPFLNPQQLVDADGGGRSRPRERESLKEEG